MMPILFILLLVLVVCSLSLPGAWAGVDFLFHPDFSKVTSSTFLNALGQSFFSLSTGMACLCTYASYFSSDVSLSRSAIQIASIDTLIAILAGLIIFPAAFATGVEADSGPSLIFITLPHVFQEAFSSVPLAGQVVSVLFYILLVLAALTSIISMHETPTAFVSEELHLKRPKASAFVTVGAMVTGALCSLSLGPCPSLSVAGQSLFDFFDFLSANVLLPAGGFFTCLYVGWVLPRRDVQSQLQRIPLSSQGGSGKVSLPVLVFLAVVRFVCPLFIFLIFLHQLGVI
jgi:NSS family neurotransmitter:Na+ symporter